jgi:hypothetical protein
VCPEHPDPMMTTSRVSLMNYGDYKIRWLNSDFDARRAVLPRDLELSSHFFSRVCFSGATFVPLGLGAAFGLESALMFANSSGTIFFTPSRAR